MSFAMQVREEIVRRTLRRDCCARAACYGIASFARFFDEKGLVLQTESKLTAHYAKKLFARFGIVGEIIIKVRPSGLVIYEFGVRNEEEIQKLLALFEMERFPAAFRINPDILRCSDCVSAYVGAAFVCGGTVTDPEKQYQLEFLTPRTGLSRDFEALLAEHHFEPHSGRRKSINLIYVKASATLEDLLTFMGAGSAAMQIMEQKAIKSVRNKANRLCNCDTANLNKTVRANTQTLRAIRILSDAGALETLPEELRKTAEVRLANPDLSLGLLCECFEPPVSKSGLSHRLKKLEALAEQLLRRREEMTAHE